MSVRNEVQSFYHTLSNLAIMLAHTLYILAPAQEMLDHIELIEQ